MMSAETPQPPAEAAPSTGDEFDSLLAEFDASGKPQASEQPAPPAPHANGKTNGKDHDAPAAPKPTGKSAQDLLADMQTLRERAVDQGERQALRDFAMATHEELNLIRDERQAELARSDFEAITTRIQEEIDDPTVPVDYVRRYLLAEVQLDPELAGAWGLRRAGEEGFKAFNSKLARVEKKLRQELASRPDRQATEDREAVTAAVRGGTGRMPAAKAPNYGRKSNREYADEVEAEFGYRPGVA